MTAEEPRMNTLHHLCDNPPPHPLLPPPPPHPLLPPPPSPPPLLFPLHHLPPPPSPLIPPPSPLIPPPFHHLLSPLPLSLHSLFHPLPSLLPLSPPFPCSSPSELHLKGVQSAARKPWQGSQHQQARPTQQEQALCVSGVWGVFEGFGGVLRGFGVF